MSKKVLSVTPQSLSVVGALAHQINKITPDSTGADALVRSYMDQVTIARLSAESERHEIRMAVENLGRRFKTKDGKRSRLNSAAKGAYNRAMKKLAYEDKQVAAAHKLGLRAAD